VAAATVAHPAAEVGGAEQPLRRQRERAGDLVDVAALDLVADLHQHVGEAHLHRDEGVVGDLDQLCVLDRGLVERAVVEGRIESARLRRRVEVAHPEEDELRLQEIADGRPHGDEERVVTELHVLVDHGQDLAANRSRQHGRDDHDDAVLAVLGDRS
jgi:hypothetical protein